MYLLEHEHDDILTVSPFTSTGSQGSKAQAMKGKRFTVLSVGRWEEERGTRGMCFYFKISSILDTHYERIFLYSIWQRKPFT